MTNQGFLTMAERTALLALVGRQSETHGAARRANALLLLDKGWSFEAVAEALFLRTFSDRITLVAHKTLELDACDRGAVEAAGIAVAPSALDQIDFAEEHVTLRLADEIENEEIARKLCMKK